MILVDELQLSPSKSHGSRYWCYMMSDDLTDRGVQELHAFAEKIGLPRKGFQDAPDQPHYKLSRYKRREAIANGAQPVSNNELVRRCLRGPEGEKLRLWLVAAGSWASWTSWLNAASLGITEVCLVPL